MPHNRPNTRKTPRPRYRVGTVTLYLTRGDEFEWKAPPDEDTTLWFPPGNPFGLTNPVTIGQGAAQVFTPLSSATPGTYEYTVYYHKTGTFAEGSSPPKIVIG